MKQDFSAPPLFSCQSPVGSPIADFNEGTHGIAGESASFVGSDHVYKIDGDHVIQCFCPSENNDGIQSNWAKLATLNDESISYYQKLGWTYVPNGLAWGLDDAAYIVKNESYACHGDLGSYNPSGDILGVSALASTGNDKSIFIYVLLGFFFAAIALRLSRE